jgi:hypothetical protein
LDSKPAAQYTRKNVKLLGKTAREEITTNQNFTIFIVSPFILQAVGICLNGEAAEHEKAGFRAPQRRSN